MSKTIIKIKTWVCSDCEYYQDFDPTNSELMALHLPGVAVGKCPSCGGEMTKETREHKKVTITIKGEDELDDMEIEENGSKRKLKKEEKYQLKAKIRADIEKFNALKD